MVEPNQPPEDQPIVEPRMIKLLRKRPKLFDIEVREKFLESLEERVRERRKPRNIGGRAVDRVQEAAKPAADDLAERKLSQMNETILKRL